MGGSFFIVFFGGEMMLADEGNAQGNRSFGDNPAALPQSKHRIQGIIRPQHSILWHRKPSKTRWPSSGPINPVSPDWSLRSHQQVIPFPIHRAAPWQQAQSPPSSPARDPWGLAQPHAKNPCLANRSPASYEGHLHTQHEPGGYSSRVPNSENSGP